MIEAFNRLNKAMNDLADTMDQFNTAIKESEVLSKEPESDSKEVAQASPEAETIIDNPVAATEAQSSTEVKKPVRKKRTTKKQKLAMEATLLAEKEQTVEVVAKESDPSQLPMTDDPSMAGITRDKTEEETTQDKIADFTKVRKVVQDLITQMGEATSVQKLLQEDFGVEKLSAMDPSDYSEFVNKVEALAKADQVIDNTIPAGLL